MTLDDINYPLCVVLFPFHWGQTLYLRRSPRTLKAIPIVLNLRLLEHVGRDRPWWGLSLPAMWIGLIQ